MAEMIFASQNGRNIPREDKIFGISNRAKARAGREGKDKVVNATIGAVSYTHLEDDYDDKDVEGKAVLVEVSYAPATPEKAMIAYRKGAKAMICMNWGRKDEAVICMRGLKGVWGNPTRESFEKIPKITGCSITRRDGDICEIFISQEKR